MEMAIGDPAYAHLPEALEAGAVERGGARRRASAGCSRPSSGWACSTTRTSTRTAPARCSPTRPTARWPGSPPSGRRCCCATRATCCRSTPAPGLDRGHRAAGRLPARHPRARGSSTSTSTRRSPCWTASGPGSATASGSSYAPGVRPAQRIFPSMFDMFGGNAPEDPADFDDDGRVRSGRSTLAGERRRRGRGGGRVAEHDRRGRLPIVAGAARPQLELLQAVVATGTPVVLLVMNGRPLDLRWAGRARAGDPRHLVSRHPGRRGRRQPAVRRRLARRQAAVQLAAHRRPGADDLLATPVSHEPENQGQRYWDEASTPLFPFGYGLSYGRFEYGDLTVDRDADHGRRDRHGVGDGHQHADRARPTRSSSSTSTSVTARRRGRSASSRASSGSRSPPASRATLQFPLGPDELRYWNAAVRGTG